MQAAARGGRARAGSAAPADSFRAVGERRILEAAALICGIAVALLSWVLLRGDDEPASGTVAVTAAGSAQVVSAEELRSIGGAEGPIYWAGERPGTRLELSRRAQGEILVRYLPEGAEPGEASGHLTIGTYRLPDALAATARIGRAEGGRLTELRRGGRLATASRQPTNGYLAYPGAPVQVEVYDPRPGRAAALIRAGRVVPAEPR